MPLGRRRRDTQSVTVRVHITGVGSRPIQALALTGEIEKGTSQKLLIKLVDDVKKLGVDCKGARNDRQGEMILTIPHSQWGVSGVREQVESIITDEFVGSGDFFM